MGQNYYRGPFGKVVPCQDDYNYLIILINLTNHLARLHFLYIFFLGGLIQMTHGCSAGRSDPDRGRGLLTFF